MKSDKQTVIGGAILWTVKKQKKGEARRGMRSSGWAPRVAEAHSRYK